MVRTSPPHDHRKSDWRSSLHEASPYLGLGMQLAFGMAFFTIGGYLLDLKIGTIPWFTIAGGLIGMVAVFVKLIRVSSDLGKQQKAPKDPPQPPSASE